jgi:hypothetical protein
VVKPVTVIIIITIIMTTVMAMPTIVAHATDVVAMVIIITTIITIKQLMVLSKERPLTSRVISMTSDYPTATMTCSPRQQKKSLNMCPAPSRVPVTSIWPWLIWFSHL